MARNKGFTIVEVVIVLLVVGIIGLIGWRVWDANQTETPDQADTSQAQSTAPDVKTDADLDKADSSLDAMDVEGSEAKQLDTETSF